MNPFSTLPQTDAAKPTEDRLPGFELPATGVYDITIKMAYLRNSSGGGKELTLLVDQDGRERQYKIYPTSKKSGTEKNTYTDKDGNEQLLAGFILADDIAVVCAGVGLGNLVTTTAVVDLVDRTTKQKTPTQVIAFPQLQDRKLCLAIQRTIESVKRKQGDKLVLTNETRQGQEIVKALYADQRTLLEVQSNVESAVWAEAWLKANQGKDRDKTEKPKAGGVAGLPTIPQSDEPVKIQFDN